MDFPTQKFEKCKIPNEIIEAFGKIPKSCYKAMDYLIVFENEKDVIEANLNFEILKKLDSKIRGIIITSKSKKYDFVNRFFASNAGINEDPVTGSAFTQLIKFKKILKKINPDELYFPSSLDLHKDHSATNLIVKNTVNELAISIKKFEYIIWTKEITLQSNKNLVIVDISNVINLKIRALNMYKSQITNFSSKQKEPILSNDFVNKFNNTEEIFEKINCEY